MSETSERILVTGATGFIGAAVARALLQRGYEVRVLARPQARTDNIDQLDVEVVRGDLRDATSLAVAVDGCQGLVHTAADYRLWAADPNEIYQSNVDGTDVLMQAAMRGGLRRVVYTSSVATLGTRVDGGTVDETADARLEDMTGHYKRSKWLAEQRVLALVEQGLPAVVVNPSAPLGPRDIKPTPTGQIILDTLRGQMPAYVDTGLNVVHVDDVAAGHVLALERGAVGRRYILGGENLSLRDILTEVCALTGRRVPKVRLPIAAVLPIAHAFELVSRFTGRPPRVTLEGVRMARAKMYFSSARAEVELGYQARPAHQAIADAVAWFETWSA